MGGTAPTQVIKCQKCGTANRVRTTKASMQPVCGDCKAPLPSPGPAPVVVTDANFAKTVEGSRLPVLLDMWAAWCGPCRIVAPTIEALAKELAGKILVGKLDVDANQLTAARFRVQSIPTLLILKNGNEVGRIVGAQSREAILSQLRPHIS
ncbi:MAG: thioredoxin [Pyrinomonadaceae bacterium]